MAFRTCAMAGSGEAHTKSCVYMNYGVISEPCMLCPCTLYLCNDMHMYCSDRKKHACTEPSRTDNLPSSCMSHILLCSNLACKSWKKGPPHREGHPSVALAIFVELRKQYLNMPPHANLTYAMIKACLSLRAPLLCLLQKNQIRRK